MTVCDTCGNDYDKPFTVTWSDGRSATFDSVECAAAQLAPECNHCGCRILGHGIETDEGIACICGDIIYHVHDSLIDPFHVGLASEPQVTGNHGNSKRHEKAAIKKALNSGTFVIPIHDYPARVEHGRILSRLGDSIPGPETPVDHRTVSESRTVAH